jgi:hypothetical protein
MFSASAVTAYLREIETDAMAAMAQFVGYCLMVRWMVA